MTKNKSYRENWGHLSRIVGVIGLLGLISLIFYVTPATAAETDEIYQKILTGQDALYRGQFDVALKLFNALIQDYPEDPKGYFFLALTYRWLTRIDPGSTTYQRQFEKAAAKSIVVAKALLKKDQNHVEAILYLAASYGYRAEYYNFLKHNWSKAYDNGVKMREYLEKAKKFSQTMIDVQLGFGLYNYYAYLYRKKIGWWRFLLSLPEGDREKGLELLETVRQKGLYAKVEAWYFLIDIYKESREERKKATVLCEELHRTYPHHPFFHTLLAGIYHKNRDWKNSIRTARDILVQAQSNVYYTDYLVYQAKYLIAEGSFFMGQYEEALLIFDEIIASQPQYPSYLLPWSHLRRGTIYNLIGQKEKAVNEYKLVLKMKNVHQVHELAKGLLKNQQKYQ